MNPRIIVGVGAAVVVAFLIAFVASSSGPSVADPDTPYGEVAVDGALPPYTGGADTAVGMAMPVASGTTLDGTPLTIEPTGSPQAIVFLAHWCSHCQREVPEVQAWLEDTGGVEGVDIVSVATAIRPDAPNYSPHAWLAEEGWAPPTLWDDENSSVLEAFGRGSFPYWVFVDGDGIVQVRASGALGAEVLEQVLVSLAG
jgi:cytochrome c biogenesis protein CcmG/thiol:disulfide interchange protein DsbE